MDINIVKVKAGLKKLEPYIAISILIFLIITSTLLYQENKITKKISEDCGWGDEDYYCVCEKSLASELKNMMDSGFNRDMTSELNSLLSDVELVE